MIRVVVADDQSILRSGLTALLRLESDLEVVAESADGDGTLRAVAEHRPDVLLLDVQMPAGTTAEGAEGPEDGIAVAELPQSQPGAPRIIVDRTRTRLN